MTKTLTAADEIRIEAAVALAAPLARGTRITFTFNGATVCGTHQGITRLRQGGRTVGLELVAEVGTDRRAYHFADVHGLALSPEATDDCTAFRVDPATADRRVRRCLCGLSERMH